MPDRPRISVIVPVYNTEGYLDRCVGSIVRQTWPNLEIILVDDGSTDGSPDLCDAWAGRDGRVAVIHKKNGGLSSARNTGIEAARGDFLGFIDSDDAIAPDMYSTLYALLLENDADISLCNFSYVDEKGREVRSAAKNKIRDEVLSREEALRRLPDYGAYGVSCNKLYRAAIFQTLRFPEGRYWEDSFLVHHIFDACRRIACTGRPLYFYLQRTGSITQTVNSSDVRRLDWAYALLDRYGFFRERGMDAEAEITLVQAYERLLKGLRHLSYFEHRDRFNEAVLCVLENLLASPRLRIRLKALRLLWAVEGNILLRGGTAGPAPEH